MSTRRFALVVVLAALVVGAGSFAAGLAVLDDGQPDPPPAPDGAAGTAALPPTESSTTTTPPTSAPAGITEGAIATPAWIAIVASEEAAATARTEAQAVAARGYPAGVLQSDDYPSLKKGLWVAYAGPYPDRAAAEAAVDALAADGVEGAYVRCAGTDKECKGDVGEGDDD